MNEFVLGILLSLVSNTSNYKLAIAIAKVESNLEPNLVTHEHNVSDVSVGLFQIRRHTAMSLGHDGDIKHLKEPLVNIYYATKYLSECQKKSKTIRETVARYNGGLYIKDVRRVRGYVNKVMCVYEGKKGCSKRRKKWKKKLIMPVNIV